MKRKNEFCVMDDENREILRGEGHIPIQKGDLFTWDSSKRGVMVKSIRFCYQEESNILWQEIQV